MKVKDTMHEKVPYARKLLMDICLDHPEEKGAGNITCRFYSRAIKLEEIATYLDDSFEGRGYVGEIICHANEI
jgi:hypothetical protein